jgi:hypothetical protein
VPPSNTPAPTDTPTPRPFTCFFEDDYGRDTSLGITDSTFVFEGPGFSASDGGVRHIRDSVLVFHRSGGALVVGFGKCPSGPASAMALDFSFPPLRLLRLLDVTP